MHTVLVVRQDMSSADMLLISCKKDMYHVFYVYFDFSSTLEFVSLDCLGLNH